MSFHRYISFMRRSGRKFMKNVREMDKKREDDKYVICHEVDDDLDAKTEGKIWVEKKKEGDDDEE